MSYQKKSIIMKLEVRLQMTKKRRKKQGKGKISSIKHHSITTSVAVIPLILS